MTVIHRSPSFDDVEWAENDYSHPVDRVHSPIPLKIEQWHAWIFSDQPIEALNDKPSPRRCHSCKKILPSDAPFIVRFCNVACRQIGKK